MKWYHRQLWETAESRYRVDEKVYYHQIMGRYFSNLIDGGIADIKGIYRQELLDILNMDDFNETEMDIALHELYGKIKDSTELIECMRKLASQFTSTDEEFGLMLLFAVDYMYLTHIFISEILDTGKITPLNLWNLRKSIF
jgi:hypothetical protein